MTKTIQFLYFLATTLIGITGILFSLDIPVLLHTPVRHKAIIVHQEYSRQTTPLAFGSYKSDEEDEEIVLNHLSKNLKQKHIQLHNRHASRPTLVYRSPWPRVNPDPL